MFQYLDRSRWFWIILAFLLAFGLAGSIEAAPPDELINALIRVESDGDDNAVGDRHLVQKAYGCLQIRQPVVDDYNRWYGTSYTAEDCLGNRDLSVLICKSYLNRYATTRRLSRKPTMEDMARIWNGGPNGWRKASTVGYWQKVCRSLEDDK